MGDFNGDGFEDVLVGAPGENGGSSQADQGAVVVAYGSAVGLNGGKASSQLYGGAGGLAGSAEAGDFLGAAVTAGDFNGDGFEDVLVGAPGENGGSSQADQGAVVVAYGSAVGLNGGKASSQLYGGAGGLAGSAEAGDFLGAAVTAGDFNGDGFEDVLVGAPGENGGSSQADQGAVVVAYGSAVGLNGGKASSQLYGGAGGLAGSAEAGDFLGAAVTAGDFNGDGFEDVLVGAPGENGGSSQADQGAVVVAYGSAVGLNGGKASSQLYGGRVVWRGRRRRGTSWGRR